MNTCSGVYICVGPAVSVKCHQLANEIQEALPAASPILCATPCSLLELGSTQALMCLPHIFFFSLLGFFFFETESYYIAQVLENT